MANGNGMNLVLLGIGGYFLYEYLTTGSLFGMTSTPMASAPVAASVQAPTSIAPSGAVSTSNGNTPATVISGQVGKFAASGALMTSSQWNYYQNQDNPGSNIILGGPNIPGGNISYNQWQAAFNSPGAVIGPQPGAVGVIGTQALNGLGMIINLQDLPIESELGWGVGEDEFDYGLGAILRGAKPGALGFRGIGGIGGIVDDPANNAAYIDEGVFIDAASTNGGLDSSSQDFYLAAGLPIK